MISDRFCGFSALDRLRRRHITKTDQQGSFHEPLSKTFLVDFLSTNRSFSGLRNDTDEILSDADSEGSCDVEILIRACLSTKNALRRIVGAGIILAPIN